MQYIKNLSYKKIKNYKIGIKIKTYKKLPNLNQIKNNNLNPLKEIYNLNFNIKSFIFKKKNKILLTTLTSPHIHKKSREQYKINNYKIYYLFIIKNINDYKKYLKYKIKLYNIYLEQGLQINFNHYKLQNIYITLPKY